MRIIIIYNEDLDRVISKLGRQNTEIYPISAIKQIEAVFINRGYDVRLIDGNLDMFEKLRDLSSGKDDLPFVFNLAYGIQGESRYSHIPSILEMLGLPYLGSGPFGHTLALDKVMSKILMNKNDILTPFFWLINSSEDFAQDFEFPVILKPVYEAGSSGVQIARKLEELTELANCLLDEFQQSVIAEKFIRGREFTLGLLGNGNNIECLPLVEIDLGGNPDEIYTSEQKLLQPKQKLIADDITGNLLISLQKKAILFFSLLRLKDYARADLRMDADGNFYFLELNSMASLISTGSYMSAAGYAGFSYDEMIIKLFEVALSKYYEKNQKLRYRIDPKFRPGV